jgi:twitching motility protein PilT
MNYKALLEAMAKVGASDLHIKVNTPPNMRINTVLRAIDHPPVTPEELDQLVEETVPQRLRERFEEEGAADFAVGLPGVGRFRFAVFHQRHNITFVIRRINNKIPPLKELNLPPAVNNLTKQNRGITLVTGITGSGKSTTLAAMVNEINQTRRDHIITIEDPIEYMFEDGKSLINQMEVGIDTPSFRMAMIRILRFDPDIILIGEMRDSDTVSAALEGADTGHLVFSTLHTSDAKQTVNRILHFFPKQDEELILEQLSLNLRAIISQQLLPRSDIKGVIPCIELLINIPIVSKLIREGRIDDIQQVLRNQDEDMQSFDVSLALLVRDNKISMDTAMKHCADEASVRRMIRGEFSAGDKGALIGGGF